MKMQCNECEGVEEHSHYKITGKGVVDRNGNPFSCTKCGSKNLVQLPEEFKGWPTNIGKKMSQEQIDTHFKKRAHEHYKEAIEPKKKESFKKALGGGGVV